MVNKKNQKKKDYKWVCDNINNYEGDKKELLMLYKNFHEATTEMMMNINDNALQHMEYEDLRFYIYKAYDLDKELNKKMDGLYNGYGSEYNFIIYEITDIYDDFTTEVKNKLLNNVDLLKDLIRLY